MTEETENLVLVQLREIRADIGQIKSKLADHDKRFDKIDARFDSLDYKLTNALGFAAMANLGAQQAESKVYDVGERQKQPEAQMVEFDRRLKRVEEPSES